jgi:hypothetical protein
MRGSPELLTRANPADIKKALPPSLFTGTRPLFMKHSKYHLSGFRNLECLLVASAVFL